MQNVEVIINTSVLSTWNLLREWNDLTTKELNDCYANKLDYNNHFTIYKWSKHHMHSKYIEFVFAKYAPNKTGKTEV